MAEGETIPGEENRKKYLKIVDDLANALGISPSRARKMLNSEAARDMFDRNPQLQEWEEKNFPDSDNFDPNDN